MSVKVAVRVRPFSQRENFLGCICCVEMKDNTTVIHENKQKNKKQHYFTFDYSFWSHDEFKIRPDGYTQPITEKYIDQERLYNTIGNEVLNNAWQGYNCCLFAYGQTGSGKSYSMLGYGPNRGIIPLVCEQLFHKIKKFEKKGLKQYEITLSMMQIYNQKVQDLFMHTNKRTHNGLKIRENKTLGVYIEGLTKHEVLNYADIERRMDEGNKNRSLASTLMNQYSSRAHTIIVIEFLQKEWINKQQIYQQRRKMNKKTSYINLVDLAGSERLAKTGILDNKDRLKEASNINKSLHTLGRVIQILAEQAIGKAKSAQVPYRDSALTRILEGALGGNSKTIMICAISPANDNYEETLSTLRYADQTKKIRNKPIVNESAVDKIIRELREQNERLKRMLEAPNEINLINSREICTDSERKQMRSNLRASMREVQKQIKKNLKSFAINTEEVDDDEESLMMTEFIDLEEPSQFFSELSFDWGNKAQVYITNLNEDQILNYKVRYSCERDLLITNKNNKKNSKGLENFVKIVLCGLGIEENHAKIVKQGDKYFIQALSESASDYTLINGRPVYEKRQLEHNDRIIMGINSIFLFKNMLKKTEQKVKLDYQFAVNERQQEMENISLIPPSSLNLFFPTNVIRDNKSKDIYSSPPTHAPSATRRLFAAPQNQKQIMLKLEGIESQFTNLVKENQLKLKEKQDFYKKKLNELKHQKNLSKEQMSSLEEKLMIKSLQSQSLKNKNAELQKLKKKLSKLNEQKSRRSKARESMLLESEDYINSVIEEDYTGQFIDLEDPNGNKAKQQFGRESENMTSTIKNNNPKIVKDKRSQNYEDIVIEEYEDTEDLLKATLNPGENIESLLLPVEPESTKMPRKNEQQSIKKQIMKNQIALLRLQEKVNKMQKMQFTRLYNIKIRSQVELQHLCQNCFKQLPKQESTGIKDNEHSSRNVSSTELEQFHFKSNMKKREKSRIRRQQLVKLQQQLRELESKLLVKQAILSQASEKSEDDLLLNYSTDRPFTHKSSMNPRDSITDRRSSFSIRRFSSGSEFQLNLTQDVKDPAIRQVVSEFIQILKELPELSLVQVTNMQIQPTIIEKNEMKLTSQINIELEHFGRKCNLKLYQIDQLSLNFSLKCQKMVNQEQEQEVQQIKLEKDQDDDLLLQNDGKNEQNLKSPLQMTETGVNTQMPFETGLSAQRQKGASFTALQNEEFDQSHQNRTQFLNYTDLKQNKSKETVQYGVNTLVHAERQIQTDKQTAQIGTIAEQIVCIDAEMITQINLESNHNLLTQNKKEQDQQELEDYLQNQEKQQKIGQQNEQIEAYLQNRGEQGEDEVKYSPQVLQMINFETNTQYILTKQISLNTSIQQLKTEKVIDFIYPIENDRQQVQDKLEKQAREREEEQALQNYIQSNKKVIQQASQSVAVNTSRRLEIILHELQIHFNAEPLEKNEYGNHIGNMKLGDQISKIKQSKLEISPSSVQQCIFPSKGQQAEGKEEIDKQSQDQSIRLSKIEQFVTEKPLMVDQEVQINVQDVIKTPVNEPQQIQHKIEEENSQEERKERRKNRVNTIEMLTKQLANTSQDFADKFNFSVSEIQKHELSYQQISGFGLDGLLREDDLNSKIQSLQDKIKELEIQAQTKQKIKTEINDKAQQANEAPKSEDKPEEQGSENNIERPPVQKKSLKKKKKKHQMTEQERRQYEIQKELEAKIIQCNNQNLLNDRNLQIHKRKREAQQLRKILIKKQKVQLQKQLLVLIPMVRRFNLIAREMKRLIEAKISIEYRNFSHYEMVEILRSYKVNKKSSGDNIQIKVLVMNLEEGRIYTWNGQVFQNRYEISEQIFQKYLEHQDDQIGPNRMLQDRAQKSKDPFWDPIDYVNQGSGYLSLQFLLYNVSYQGYISIVYKSIIVAKLFVSLTPVKVTKYGEDDQAQGQYSELSELESIEIGNQRNLLQKDLYFTLCVESIKFIKDDERHKAGQSTNSININSLNSNILKYSITYQLLQNDYKVVEYTTPEIQFIEDKQFKRIDYMRRHSLKNISESTLAYISDCPVKFTLNVMKDYNQECLNASFSEELSDTDPANSDMNTSLFSDSKSVADKKNSINVQDLPKQFQPRTDFSKKPNMIYENIDVISQLQYDSKRQQDKIESAKKMQEVRRKMARNQKSGNSRDKDKDKDKDCLIF